jgi:HAD superfamily hydrolase (TIGR01509 family)
LTIERSPRCFIFDLDGVLLDTEPFYTEVTQAIVAEYGKTFDWSVKQHMIGRHALDAARYLVDALDLPITAENYLERRVTLLEERFVRSPAKPGAEAFTRKAAAAGVPMAIATSSERRQFEMKSTLHREWFSLFGCTVTGDDPRVARGKPAPDIFLQAAEDLGAVPAECLVFEDAPSGVAAACAAGMQVVALPDPAMDRAKYEAADLIVAGFEDLTLADLGLTGV